MVRFAQSAVTIPSVFARPVTPGERFVAKYFAREHWVLDDARGQFWLIELRLRAFAYKLITLLRNENFAIRSQCLARTTLVGFVLYVEK